RAPAAAFLIFRSHPECSAPICHPFVPAKEGPTSSVDTYRQRWSPSSSRPTDPPARRPCLQYSSRRAKQNEVETRAASPDNLYSRTDDRLHLRRAPRVLHTQGTAPAS